MPPAKSVRRDGRRRTVDIGKFWQDDLAVALADPGLRHALDNTPSEAELVLPVLYWLCRGKLAADITYLLHNVAPSELPRLLTHRVALSHDVEPAVLVEASRLRRGFDLDDIRGAIWCRNGWSCTPPAVVEQWREVFGDAPRAGAGSQWRVLDFDEPARFDRPGGRARRYESGELTREDAARIAGTAVEACWWREHATVRAAQRLRDVGFGKFELRQCIRHGYTVDEVSALSSVLRSTRGPSAPRSARMIVTETTSYITAGIPVGRACLAAKTNTPSTVAATYDDDQWQSLLTLQALATAFTEPGGTRR